MSSSMPNAMFMNGPKTGQMIVLPDPLPDSVTVGMVINICKHRSETSTPTISVLYKVHKPVNERLPYSLITEDKTIASGYYCMECKADSEAKYKLRQVRDQLNILLEEVEDDD